MKDEGARIKDQGSRIKEQGARRGASSKEKDNKTTRNKITQNKTYLKTRTRSSRQRMGLEKRVQKRITSVSCLVS